MFPLSTHRSFPKAIIHVDGDAFFASCEIAQNESLRGKPVVTGTTRGIATAISYEARSLGVYRGMTIAEIKKLYPQVIVTESNYDLYGITARRVYEIVRRYTPEVEEYSIDECFADITGMRQSLHMSYIDIAKAIKHDLETDLGMTFSLGLAPTKVLAKVASKCKKPAGFTAIPVSKIEQFLKPIAIGQVWGIGPNSSAFLQKQGITTALQFIQKPQWWIEEKLSKPHQEIWHELRGTQVLSLNTANIRKHKSVMKTRTFKPATNDRAYLLSELCKNTEQACQTLRIHGLLASSARVFLKTQLEFRYKSMELEFDIPLNNPQDVMNLITEHFTKIYTPGVIYRSSGIVFSSITPISTEQQSLFGGKTETRSVLTAVDSITNTFGNQSVFLARSLKAREARRSKSKPTVHDAMILLSERLGIPYWGEAQ